MTNATLQAFRDIAETMIGTADWQWIGPHMSQRMFGITRERAEGYAKAHGGTAQPMKAEHVAPSTMTRVIHLVVLNSGRIRVMFGGVVGSTYDSWHHWFQNGITAYADGDFVLVHCVRGTTWAND